MAATLGWVVFFLVTAFAAVSAAWKIMGGENGNAVSGYSLRLDRLRMDLLADLDCFHLHPEGLWGVVLWHLGSAGSRGLELNDVRSMILAVASTQVGSVGDEINAVLQASDGQALAMAKPIPRCSVGDPVEVIVNAKNLTPHVGKVREVIWHSQERRWNYYIEESGKKVPKCYLACDLKPSATPASQ